MRILTVNRVMFLVVLLQRLLQRIAVTQLSEVEELQRQQKALKLREALAQSEATRAARINERLRDFVA